MPRAKRRALGRHTPQRARARQRQQVQENDGPDDHVNVDLEIQVNQFENLPTALRYDPATFTYKCTIGGLTVQCTQCNASKFPDESVGMCCSNGKVDLPSLPDLPAELATLFKGESEESIHFLSNLRQYNCAFQMTSFGCKEVTLTGWNPNFRIQGQVCHLIGALEPATQQEASYLQIYFMDGEMEQAHRRISLFDGLRPELIFLLQDLLHIHNKYVKQLKSAYEFARNRNFPTYRIVICENVRPPGEHERRYNLPEANEVAILMPNDPIGHRDIVLHARTNELRRISELHKSYDALQYPLLFPFGTDGWSLQLKLGSRHKITQLQYYCFNIFTRHSNYLLLGRRLFQQYLVDSYAKIESERLQFLRREQGRLRAENYNDLRDSILHNDGNPHNVGQRVILPATYCGGPRYMFERQQDAMSYVRKFGRPDLFITATTNPGWTEIKENLSVGQQPHDRPDLIVRVFRQKLKKLMDFLKEGAFGPLQAWLYSIEFQKRGLPHAHILLWLQKENKIHPEMIDRVICAELPDKTVDPHLFNIVEKNMIHGPCGPGQMSPCMKDGKCTKSFPRPFLQNTELGTDSYPKYRRRQPCDGGGTAVVKRGREEINVDNRWVVPYNPWLLRQMDCHVNVELCMSVKSIKYVLKYVHKGADQATFQLQSDNNKDEISNFVNSRYIGSTEAAWRIFEMPLHERYPPVVQLSVHLENGQRVYFNEDTAVDTANAEPRPTTLTAFFELCGSDPFAATITYQDVPKYYTWNTTQKKWNRRKRGTPTVFPDVFETPTLGRIYTISPKQAECFYLRLLLLTVEGPISFDSLKSYDGHVYPTYRDCCIARGLLEDDNMHRQTIEEAAVSSLPKALRNLFAVLLTQACPSDPKALWEEFQQQLSEDFFSNLETTEASRNSALIDIEDTVLAMGGTTLGNLGLPQPIRGAAERIGQDYQREISYNIEEQRQKADLNLNNLTEDQSRIFYDFIGHLQAGHYGLFFLDAPGGCGKTYLLETILATVRGHNQICIATASSGLAATLLPGGRTVHSTFKVPLSVANMDLPTCNIKKGTSLSRLLQEAAVLIIDEAPMLHRKVLEALDRTLRDIRSSENTMGGLLTLMCGDFRQILPVVPHGTRANIIDACIKESQLWQNTHTYSLTTNMRVALTRHREAHLFANQLLRIGNGSIPLLQEPNLIYLIGFGNFCESPEDLIDHVFPDLAHNHKNTIWLTERAILAPHNESTSVLNDLLTERMPGDPTIYTSINTVSEEESVTYPTEFLNSIEVSGLPPHRLVLKLGMPVMILRSLHPPVLMNGTRCIITSCMRNSIEVEVATGPYSGERHFIPRIPLQPSDAHLPFQFQRKQLPIRPCFAMTINKSQGQTLKTIGLDLRQPIFTHGMLYVALSRTGHSDSVHILAPNRQCHNVVFKEIL